MRAKLRRGRVIGMAAVAAALLIMLAAAVAPADMSPPIALPALTVRPAAVPTDRTVTLITGDRVTLAGGDASRPSIEPGAGRQRVTFSTLRMDGRMYVVPSDVSRLVSGGSLDRRLFDVAGLIRDGYDDARRTDVPLIVKYRGAAGRSAMSAAGARTMRALPAIDGAAVRVPKRTAASFVDQLPIDGIARIWLDGRRRVTLDDSVPQIGAPAAWQAGFSGKGVTVAVLDSGIDAEHPDLAGRITEAMDFTGSGPGDQVGHGTHVAATIAGTRGVAMDARLLDGKVCGSCGCEESAILAGMHWAAVEKRARVINLSLGGGDLSEIDPLEEAVNELTAQTGARFVVAAGNYGPGATSVGSPGSAEAALTVGAVDKQDQLAEFSSRGPRVGDHGLKPDITAARGRHRCREGGRHRARRACR
jgi:subtilisin family serine protease